MTAHYCPECGLEHLLASDNDGLAAERAKRDAKPDIDVEALAKAEWNTGPRSEEGPWEDASEEHRRYTREVAAAIAREYAAIKGAQHDD